jgi:hypothetical protein
MKRPARYSTSYQQMLQQNISEKVQYILNNDRRTTENPVIKASQTWNIISEQVKDILDESIYKQWFSKIVPLVIVNDILILQAPNKFSCHWLTRHYQALVDLLLSFHEKDLSCYFVSENPND